MMPQSIYARNAVSTLTVNPPSVTPIVADGVDVSEQVRGSPFSAPVPAIPPLTLTLAFASLSRRPETLATLTELHLETPIIRNTEQEGLLTSSALLTPVQAPFLPVSDVLCSNDSQHGPLGMPSKRLPSTQVLPSRINDASSTTRLTSDALRSAELSLPNVPAGEQLDLARTKRDNSIPTESERTLYPPLTPIARREQETLPPPTSDIQDYRAELTPFIYKLYCLVSDENSDDLVCWSNDGHAFVVWNVTAFAARVLPNYFRHKQFSSFVRQLNKYRFNKLTSRAYLFGHERFIRGRPELLREIGRQHSLARSPSPKPLHTKSRSLVRRRVTPPARKLNKLPGLANHTKLSVYVSMASMRGEIAVLRQENARLRNRTRALEDKLVELQRHYLHTDANQYVFTTAPRQPSIITGGSPSVLGPAHQSCTM